MIRMTEKRKEEVKGRIVSDKVIVPRDTPEKDVVELLCSNQCFGSFEKNSLVLSLIEALFLIEQGKLVVYKSKNSFFDYNSFLSKAVKLDKRFLQRYLVFKDLRLRGYILRAALKYGADFLVYGRGKKPGKGHSKWLLFVASEGEVYSWRAWVANNRVAHSVRKKILLGIVDDNSDVTYYDVGWVRP
jgi:tRNA-intron endonuclease